MTEPRVLSNGDKATLLRGVSVTDTRTLHVLTGDKLTISDHVTLAQDDYFIVDVTGTVFKWVGTRPDFITDWHRDVRRQKKDAKPVER